MFSTPQDGDVLFYHMKAYVSRAGELREYWIFKKLLSFD